ncbi:MAG: MFS transporter [Pseudomonadota bacterium]
MAVRWRILALLFTVRAVMGFQFQAIGALSLVVMEAYGVALADIGLIVGLYLAPGVILALPGGSLGARLGDKQVVMIGLALMLGGAIWAVLATGWEVQIAARIVAGIGGVLLNVIMSKMVTDWFAGREIATSMAIFVNSWPVGIAIALGVLPWVAASGGLGGALILVSVLAGLGLLAIAMVYTDAPGAGAPGQIQNAAPRGAVRGAVLMAGLVWGTYNGALGMIFSFGPVLLTERGWSLAEASGASSLVLWVDALSIPLGGVLADRLGQRDAIILLACLGMGALMAWVPYADDELIWPLLAVLGFIAGLPPGPIMSLPSLVLRPENRAVGMGYFYSVFYACVVAAPFFAGWVADLAGSATATFQTGAALLVVSCLSLAVFHRIARRGQI